jgi:adenylate kinase
MDITNISSDIEKIKKWLGTGSINIFGFPFAGKDTLAHVMGQQLGAPVISGGDILRSHHDKEKISELMSTGKLFPTDFYLEIITPYLKQDRLKKMPLALSSVGRWKGEERTILKACKDAGHPIKAVVHLNVPEEVVWKRFEASKEVRDREHRLDDAVHILEERLKEYRTKTLPVLEYYREQGLLVEVDGQLQRKSTLKETIKQLVAFIDAN